MSRATIESSITAALDAVSGVENVVAGRLNKLNAADFITAYREADGSDIQVWFVRRVASPGRAAETARGRGVIPIRVELWRDHSFTVDAYFSFKDNDSEARFQTLIDAVLAAFDNERTLGGFQASMLDLTQINDDLFGGVACTHAHFQITVIERRTGIVPA